MAYNVDNIINVNTSISAGGISNANFGTAVLFAPETELPVLFDKDSYRTYNSLAELSTDFDSTTETYKSASYWLGGIPAMRELIVYGRDDEDASYAITLNKARNQIWWYWSLFIAAVYAVEIDVLDIAAWSESNESFFIDNQTGANTALIRDPVETEDIASKLTALGYRMSFTLAHATEKFAGTALAKFFAAVNYEATNSTITGEFKTLSGVASESLTGTEYEAMKQDTKKCVFYSAVDLQGSTDSGRVLNSLTHSSYGEYIDDVVNLSAFTNALKTALYNTLVGSVSKIGQDPAGQSLLLSAAKTVCEQYIANGYLGQRNYVDPDDGVSKFTFGYEILTKPEDILDLSEADRLSRKSAPIRIRVFRKGAIHAVDVSVDVY